MKKFKYYFHDCKFTHPLLEIRPVYGDAGLKEIRLLYTDRVQCVYASRNIKREINVCFLSGERDEVRLK
jgi:hypothetical protein